ncbi:hypothetical protein FRC11_000483 [Ceratobasidium sp. 423]|nr:hypothetical protein FRC11_000483 [Ceratobasidium sp. 423]
MNPSDSEEQPSSDEERIPPPKLDSDVEQIPRPPSTINEPIDTTVYVMDSNWTNTGHAMVPWYEGFQGEKRFYRRHRDGNYERIPGPGEELTALRPKSYSPEVPLYTIWNSEMVPYNPMIHEWDTDTYFLRGDGRYQKWKLPGDPRPPLIISWPPPKVDPSPLGIDPVFITINIGDNEDTSHLPPPIQPTVLYQPTSESTSAPILTPQKRIEAPPQHQPASVTNQLSLQNQEQVETPSKSGRVAWSNRTGRDSDSPLSRKLPQAPTNKPATTISTPAPKRPVTLEDLPESPTLFHAPPPTPVHTQASLRLSELPKPTFLESPPATSTPKPLHPGFSRKRSKSRKRDYSMKDIPEDPTNIRSPPPHENPSGFINPEAKNVPSALGGRRVTRFKDSDYKPGLEPSSFTPVAPIPPSPAESRRSPDLGPAPKPTTGKSSITITHEGPSLHATQTGNTYIPTEPSAPKEIPRYPTPAPDLLTSVTARPSVIPATVMPSNKEDLVQVPFSHR